MSYGRFLAALHPEDRERTDAAVRACLESGGQRDYDIEYRTVWPDGAVRWIQAKGSATFEKGQPVRMAGLALDITERKQAEAERERLLAEEQQARETAEAATRAKDEFLAVVSHELRTSLTAILGYTRMTRSNPHDAAQVARNCEIIERSAKTQQQLIEDLLDTARIISGKLKLEVAPTDLRLVLEDAVEVTRAAAEAKRIDLVTRLDDASQEILGDAARLRQIVWNLLQTSPSRCHCARHRSPRTCRRHAPSPKSAANREPFRWKICRGLTARACWWWTIRKRRERWSPPRSANGARR
jgi:signal transduction histidine kinase